jgi:hypothetical protein
MDTVEFIRQAVDAVHGKVDDATTPMTAELLNNVPPGTANPISAVFVHCVSIEDLFIQDVLQGKPRLWELQGWQSKIGVQHSPDYGGNWDEFKHCTLALEPLLAYQQAVRSATSAYLQHLTLDDLDRPVKFHGRDRSVASMLTLLITHTMCHAGEIAVLKGIQGVKGLPN